MITNQNIININPLLYQQNLMLLQNANSMNIFDCFNYYYRFQLMDGDNAMYCNRCNQLLTFGRSEFIATGPEILIVLLNRGKSIEFNIKLEFVEYLSYSSKETELN